MSINPDRETRSLEATTTDDRRPTPTRSASLPLKLHRFESLPEALEYAAQGEAGYNFYNLRGELRDVLSYAQLKQEAEALANRLAVRFNRGDRIALVAETSADFMRVFFACQYAGLIPAPMPLPVNLGGKEGYLVQIRQMVEGSDARCAVGPAAIVDFLREATEGLEDVEVFDFEEMKALPGNGVAAEPFGPDENCYIQYSSGSTSAPKGVIGTQKSVTSNLHAITKHGLKLVDDDRAASWLPLYHDMGLIGFALSAMFGQRSVDFIATSDFVRRPLLWLRLMTDNKCTITYSPSFGYDLSARRAARAEPGSIDLSHLRIAGIGGDMVRTEALQQFTDAFGPFGFNDAAFLPSYGLAEATLAISFTVIGEPIDIDDVDMRHYNRSGVAQPASAVTAPDQLRRFVSCGKALPGHAIEVRGDAGAIENDREVGRVFIRGPSVTPGYFSDAAASEAMFDGEWLNTGDMGYMLDGQLYITGRAKDLIIINGRNIWPQDIEWAAEKVEGVREGGVAAFSVDNGGTERIVAVVERRGGLSAEATAELRKDVASVIQTAVGAPAEIVLVRPHSMVITSSGKLSRAKVKAKYVAGAFDDNVDGEDGSPALAEAHL